MNPYISGIIVLLVLVPIAVAVWWGMLRLMDKAAGVYFREEIQNMDVPMAIYYAGRAIASAYLVASLFSRFI